MNKNFITKIIAIALLFITSLVFAKPRFYLQNKFGALIKVNVASAYKGLYPKQKGPTLFEIPSIIKSKQFEDYSSRANSSQTLVLLKYYKQIDSTDDYQLILNRDDLNILQHINQILLTKKITLSNIKKIKIHIFNNKILPLLNESDTNFIKKYYKLSANSKLYNSTLDWKTIDKFVEIRMVLLQLNRDNEIKSDIDDYGSPMPHNFPRVHNAKTKANFDIHLTWGVRLDNDLTIGFGLNITNFTMFSLELLMIKYNFNIPGYPFEPYIGGALYGGYADGFPIGINFLGGFDFFPFAKQANNFTTERKFYLSTEVRIGPVIYIPRYYDTGLNTETIYKKIGVLMEGGLYFAYGYIFDNN